MSRELLQQALNALLISAPLGHAVEDYEYRHRLIKDIEQELAKPEQEPVGRFIYVVDSDAWVQDYSNTIGQPLYTAPSRKEWVGLTDEEINDFDKKLRDNGDYCSLHFAWGISAKLKEKNT